MDVQSKIALAVLANNIAPMAGTSISPLTALTGRSPLVGDLQRSPMSKDDLRGHESYSLWKRLVGIKSSRGWIMRFVPQRPIRLYLTGNRRCGDYRLFQEGDHVPIYMPRREKWVATYRVLHDTGRNGVVARGNALCKHAKSWARLLGHDSSIYPLSY